MIHFIKKTVLLAILLFTLIFTGIAQPSTPGFGEEDDQPAPIGSGIVILLVLAGVYGAKKVVDAKGSHTSKEPSE
jgi:hypothetical protein